MSDFTMQNIKAHPAAFLGPFVAGTLGIVVFLIHCFLTDHISEGQAVLSGIIITNAWNFYTRRRVEPTAVYWLVAYLMIISQ